MFSDNFGEKGGGHYMCLVGEKRVAFRENDSFPIKLMERRRPQQTRTENDYQQLDEGSHCIIKSQLICLKQVKNQ